VLDRVRAGGVQAVEAELEVEAAQNA
jgi:hypothetical protein